MVVVLIIGILISIAIPMFNAITARARMRTCFANQRNIIGAVAMWRVDATTSLSTLAGVLDASNPLMNPLYLLRPPRCPSAPTPVDANNPTTAEGAYSIDTSGNVIACGFGDPAHGRFY
jgi:type II secretory pathway pseudopilin PulG